ncbi:MAG: hypothetical protein ACYDBQ_01525 [Thermoplasmatota archaeon]
MAKESQALRESACCHSEPECVLCPLLPQNEGRTLAELAALGLRGRLPEAIGNALPASRPSP